MHIAECTDQRQWDDYLASQRYRPFLQSWTMGEVYRDIGQKPVRLGMHDDKGLAGICQAIVVPARRGRHLAVSYGPVLSSHLSGISSQLFEALRETAKEHQCTFIRLSPFWPAADAPHISGSLPSPLHLLAEHLWYIPLKNPDAWHAPTPYPQHPSPSVSEDSILSSMRKTTRNLIRRAERDGVTIERSADPVADLPAFITLHDETRKRHGFTPYSNAFFESQVKRFSARNECTLYKAHFEGKIIAASIHMHAFAETSYHHGASTHAYAKIPASYLLQWTAIRDALRRGDRVYNFWGISPEGQRKHPFAGVRLFKTGFGGNLLELMHCVDVPVERSYYLTRGFETLRKWHRGF
ncbi:peptidoglycan bridge formation glycyltransferase FemA/FemB family protein [Candidatus Peregrinibacteria bacterium]|nr:peptidoglycan bridge formation glycyltransferase FemA/FemB family protein [Candidatus Peregrinibacteria bacterium]